MNTTHSLPTRIVLGCCLLTVAAAFVAPEARAQDGHMPFISAPAPPMKFVSRGERTQLSATRDAKARTRATIELAEMRLARAEQLTAEQNYNAASGELGIYQGLIEDALDHLDDITKNDNKLRDTYKRLELALRAHCMRLEAIRRVTPSEYAVHVKAICECARNARSEALNSFYGDTVVPAASLRDEAKAGGDESAKDSAKKQ
ncbi:MAG TPA: hypothetical protein VN256_10020 [Pyrinomonadaceae bacterium]|nr:hypothetical protein [Pyrinomonadaceae bacterium]